MKKNGKSRTPRRLPEFLTDQERERYLGQVDMDRTAGLRNLCLVRMMLNYGLRAAELRDLRHKNVDWDTGQMFVRQGKNSKDRSLWISDDDLRLLNKWLAYKASCGAKTDLSAYLFTDLTGCKPLCLRWYRKFVKRLAEKAGVNKDIHPHSLRHSFASRLLRHSKNLYLVSRALGHAHVSSTEIYLHLQDHELEEALRGMNGNS